MRPWVNFKAFAQERGLLRPLLELVSTYFNFMLGYIQLRPYVPPIHYDEREWLAFRAIFVKAYKAKNVTLNEGNRVPVTKLYARPVSCSKFSGIKSRASVFVPEFDSASEPLPTGWVICKKEEPTFGVHGLGVGIFAWWGEVDKVKQLNSPQKNVSPSIKLLQKINNIFTEYSPSMLNA